jgi:hypothetical protein
MYPYFPIIALVIAVFALIAITYFNREVAGLFLLLGLLGAAISMRRIRSASAGAGTPEA